MTAYSAQFCLIVVDFQNDFADSAGSLFVESSPRLLDFINHEAADAAASGALLVRSQDWHPESTPHFAKDGGVWPVHCVAGSWGAEFHPDLRVEGPVVRKGVGGEDGYSAFTVRDPETGEESQTGLEEILTERGITDVIVCGLATDYCVKETARDAARLGFATTLLADGIGPVNVEPGDGARAIASMIASGVAVE
ncbi:MAG: isochorismatase family protein [Acidimicrobiia bacterium]